MQRQHECELARGPLSAVSPADRELQILEWAFGKRVTPAERLRKNQRLLDKAIRELDQQRVKLEKQEKTLVAQIRQSAQKGQMGACKVQAKDLVRTRRYGWPPYRLRRHFLTTSAQICRKVLCDALQPSKDLAPAPGPYRPSPSPPSPLLTQSPPSRPTARTSR